MEIIGLDDLSNPEGIFRHIDWKPDLVDVGQVYKSLQLPQVKNYRVAPRHSLKFIIFPHPHSITKFLPMFLFSEILPAIRFNGKCLTIQGKFANLNLIWLILVIVGW